MGGGLPPLFPYLASHNLRCLFWGILKHIWLQKNRGVILHLWFPTGRVEGAGVALRMKSQPLCQPTISPSHQLLTFPDAENIHTSVRHPIQLPWLPLGYFSYSDWCLFKENHKHMLNFYIKHLLKYNMESPELSQENNHFPTCQEQNEGSGWKRLYYYPC